MRRVFNILLVIETLDSPVTKSIGYSRSFLMPFRTRWRASDCFRTPLQPDLDPPPISRRPGSCLSRVFDDVAAVNAGSGPVVGPRLGPDGVSRALMDCTWSGPRLDPKCRAEVADSQTPIEGEQ